MRKVIALVIILAFGTAIYAAEDKTDPRRTPAVEVFQKNKDAVVFLTGPKLGDRSEETAEFFLLSKIVFLMNQSTGFVIHESGYILSNAHVVQKMIRHEVVLSDDKKYPAELLAVVRQYDMALLKIDAGRPLKAVQMGKSGDLMIGEPVIVIANPRGLVRTCTTGVVSALERKTMSSSMKGIFLRDLIQTDASINPGSSGGPWFNALGDVIGMTTSMRAETIGFGIPVATIRQVLPEMLDIENREGISTGIVLLQQEKCQVASVEKGSPAEAAGIRAGDMVAKLDGKPLASRLDYCLAMVGRKAKDTLKLELLREGKTVEASLVLAVHPKPDGAAMLKTKYGLAAIPLDEAKSKETSMRDQRGVVITEVTKGKPWEYEKVKTPPLAGDVLASIDGIRPRDLDHAGRILERLKPGDKASMVFLRRKGAVVTRVDLDVKTP